MKHLAIGPGAVGYFALLGALNGLWDSGDLDDLESLSGSSAGALLCCMAAVTNFDFTKMVNKSLKVPLKKLKPQIKSLFTSYGLVPRESIRDMILDTLIPGKLDITFSELYDIFPKKIYISAFCIQLTQTHYFSVVTHPDMSVIDALCMSISVPFLFSSFTYGEWTYLDGGSVESSPCAPYLAETREDVLILRLQFKDTYDIKDFVGYVYMIFNSICKIRYVYDFPTRFIDVGDTDVLDFSCSDELKIRLFTDGYKYIKK
jgi:predicted acylesterase/phospholipase RssA